jgi:hypothetical protein
MLRHVMWYKFTDILEMFTASIIKAVTALMMEAVRNSETSVNFYQTIRRNIPPESHLHTHHSPP